MATGSVDKRRPARWWRRHDVAGVTTDGGPVQSSAARSRELPGRSVGRRLAAAADQRVARPGQGLAAAGQQLVVVAWAAVARAPAARRGREVVQRGEQAVRLVEEERTVAATGKGYGGAERPAMVFIGAG